MPRICPGAYESEMKKDDVFVCKEMGAAILYTKRQCWLHSKHNSALIALTDEEKRRTPVCCGKVNHKRNLNVHRCTKEHIMCLLDVKPEEFEWALKKLYAMRQINPTIFRE
jgi:hypothetical protein